MQRLVTGRVGKKLGWRNVISSGNATSSHSTLSGPHVIDEHNTLHERQSCHYS